MVVWLSQRGDKLAGILLFPFEYTSCSNKIIFIKNDKLYNDLVFYIALFGIWVHDPTSNMIYTLFHMLSYLVGSLTYSLLLFSVIICISHVWPLCVAKVHEGEGGGEAKFSRTKLCNSIVLGQGFVVGDMQLQLFATITIRLSYHINMFWMEQVCLDSRRDAATHTLS